MAGLFLLYDLAMHTSRITRGFAAFLVCSAICLIGCASTPSVEEQSASARILKREDLSRILGANRFENPFFEPISLIFGQKDEFVVVEISLNAPARAQVSIAGELTMAGGVDRIPPMYLEQFKDFWSQYVEQQGADRRSGKIETYCLPGPSLMAPRGSHRYLLVFVGPKPIVRPARIGLAVTFQGSETVRFDLLLEP